MKKEFIMSVNQQQQPIQGGGKANPEAKSFLVALLLSIFAGSLGIDRFYLGYTGLGILKLLTLGGFGIWAIIDMILVATKNLGPADGSEYTD